MSLGRETARKVLARVETEGAFAAAALAAETMTLKDEREAALAFELVLGCLRRESWLDHLLSSVSDRGLKKIDPAVMRILRIAAYQIAFLSRIPAAAAVNDAVNACKRTRAARLAGLTNALLRKVASLPEASLRPAETDDGAAIDVLTLRCGLPELVLAELIERFGRDGALGIAQTFNGPSRRTLRINRHRISREDAATRIGERSTLGRLSPWAVDAPSMRSAAPLIESGLAAYQDEAAQLAVIALAPEPSDAVLDACAGRGGKTAAIAALMEGNGQIAAVDRAGAKLDRLAFELSKQQLRAETAVCDLSTAPPPFAESFDRVLVDAPCSGSGTLGRRPEIRRRLTRASVDELIAIQRAVLANAARAVRPGGRLVYVVCSLLQGEGFGQEASFTSAHPNFSLVSSPPPDWPAEVPWQGGRILIDPSLYQTDGYQFLVFERADS